MAGYRLSYRSPGASGEINIREGRTTFGRGSDAEHRFDDDGLSRLNSTIYNENGRIWIVDENSTNGTLVNGSPASASGTPLKSGDVIKIGNSTEMTFVSASSGVQTAPSVNKKSAAAGSGGTKMLLFGMIAFAFLIISGTTVLIAMNVISDDSKKPVFVSNNGDDDIDLPISATPSPTLTPTGRPNMPDAQDNKDVILPSGETSPVKTAEEILPEGKTYLDLSDEQKRKYIAAKSMTIAQIIGNSSSNQIPDDAITPIKTFADAYAKRLKVKPLGGCRFGDNLLTTYTRASKNAPFIVRAFNEKGMDPRIGLYLAMIESEHCVCLQSPTGPLGMFQFTQATGRTHGLDTKPGASPTNPDERCEPAPSAAAAASYMKSLSGRYGTGAASIPLAIGSYNSGEGGLSSNLVKAIESGTGLPRDFWTLIANGDKLSTQFQSENFKYVPKFFAAAIVGENPKDFGLDLQPISTYTK